MKVEKSESKHTPKYPNYRQLSDYKALAGIAAIGLSTMTGCSPAGKPVEPRARTPVTATRQETPPPRLGGEIAVEPRLGGKIKAEPRLAGTPPVKPAATNPPPHKAQ